MRWIFLFLAMIFLIPLASAKLNVAVSIADFEAIAKEIGGDEINITVILPAGSDPHSFSLDKKKLDALNKADLIILANSNLLSYEKKIKENFDKEFLDFENYEKYNVTLLDFNGFKNNPHGYWLYINNSIAIAKAIAYKLAELIPEKEDYFMQNLGEFEKEVRYAHAIIINISKEKGLYGKKFVAAVPGVCYIAENVGMKADEILLSEASALPNAEKLGEIERKLENKEYMAIILPEFMKDSKAGEIAKQIASDTNCSIVYVKFGVGGDSYISIFYYNAIQLLSLQPYSKSTHNSYLIYLSTLLAVLAGIEALIIYNLSRRW
ncbi:MAG: hypothetical protein DRN11_01490 [Thermoplasmata archaeon]|nr:MAG: hypothetical protein DRN11_01490 [Thermoplasmata archaeon]